jgi:hypothetical protein
MIRLEYAQASGTMNALNCSSPTTRDIIQKFVYALEFNLEFIYSRLKLAHMDIG